jgi:hypothetical protein
MQGVRASASSGHSATAARKSETLCSACKVCVPRVEHGTDAPAYTGSPSRQSPRYGIAVNTCRAQGKGGARVGRRATASVVGRSRGLAWCQTSTAFIQGALRESLNWVLSEGLLRLGVLSEGLLRLGVLSEGLLRLGVLSEGLLRLGCMASETAASSLCYLTGVICQGPDNECYLS